MNTRRKPRALPDTLEPRLQAPCPGERRTRQGGGSRNPVAHARLRGENRGGGSSPERRGGRTRWALPRSPSGSPPRAWPSTLPRAAVLQSLAVKKAPGTGRRRTPERGPIPGRAAEIRPASLRASAGAGGLLPRCQAAAGWASSGAGPVPWQRRGLRRPTAAKPRCGSSRGLPG